MENFIANENKYFQNNKEENTNILGNHAGEKKMNKSVANSESFGLNSFSGNVNILTKSCNNVDTLVPFKKVNIAKQYRMNLFK